MLKQTGILLTALFSLSLTGHLKADEATNPFPDQAVIFLYHHISDVKKKVTSVSPDIFEQQMQYLQDNDFTVWPLRKIITSLNNSTSIPDKTVAITFDDNFESVYSEAYPQLKKRNWPFTIFVNTDDVDQKINYQNTWEQLRIMAKNGATVANHASYHGHLLDRHSNESESAWLNRVSANIIKAQQRIKEEVGSDEQLFAYPYGEFNEALKQRVAELGYTAFGQQSGAVGKSTDQLAIPRFAIAGEYVNIKDFSVKANSLAFNIESIEFDDNPLKSDNAKPQLTLYFNRDSSVDTRFQCFATQQGKLQILPGTSDSNKVTVYPSDDIPFGRSRYNCTQPAGQGRFFWYSHIWLRPRPVTADK